MLKVLFSLWQRNSSKSVVLWECNNWVGVKLSRGRKAQRSRQCRTVPESECPIFCVVFVLCCFLLFLICSYFWFLKMFITTYVFSSKQIACDYEKHIFYCYYQVSLHCCPALLQWELPFYNGLFYITFSRLMLLYCSSSEIWKYQIPHSQKNVCTECLSWLTGGF